MIGSEGMTRAEVLQACREGPGAWDDHFLDNLLHLTNGLQLQEYQEARREAPEAFRGDLDRLYIDRRAQVKRRGPARKPAAVVQAEGIQEEAVNWLWYPYIPKGKITIMAGPAGTGKTFMTAYLAAAVSTGRPFPGEEEGRKERNVLLINAEDGLGDTIRPRLRMAGADLRRVYLADIPLDGEPITFDSPQVRHMIAQTAPALVIFDPFQAFLGARVDVNRSNETRPMLAQLLKLAETYNTAILIVMHLSKMTTASFMARVLGSVDIAAASRSVIGICPHPSLDDEKVFSHEKSNLAQNGCSYSYTIQDGAVLFGDPIDLKADDCLQLRKKKAAPKIAQARALIERILAEHPGEWVDARQIFQAAEAAGVGMRTVQDAVQALPVKRRKDGFRGPVQWQLVPDEDDDF